MPPLERQFSAGVYWSNETPWRLLVIAAGWKVLGLLAAGTGLGSVLASFVDPVPRQPERPSALASARPDLSAASSYQFVEIGPENLSPPSLPDGYAPGWASGDKGVWQYPEPALPAWEPAPYPRVADLDGQLAEDTSILDSGAENARLAANEPGAAPVAEAPAATERHLAALY